MFLRKSKFHKRSIVHLKIGKFIYNIIWKGLIRLSRHRTGMTWTLAILGASIVAYGVTKSVTSNKRMTNHQIGTLDISPDMPEIF